MAQTGMPATYPVRLEVDYPANSNRVTALFRLFLVLPMLALASMLTGVVVVPTALMLLFRRRYPRWWFDWNREVTRFSARVCVYAFLLSDAYPSTEEEQAVHLAIDEPNASTLNRWLPLVKWFLLIPHYVVVAVLLTAACLTTLAAWLAILVTGSYPRGLFDFAVGVLRWTERVTGYGFLLVTDRYPPFSLK